MTIERSRIDVAGLPVEIVRKDIKNLHLGVYPPAGRIRVAVPLRIDDEAVRLPITSRLEWIRRARRRFEEQARHSRREMVTGESHYFQGRRYRLHVVEADGAPGVILTNNTAMVLRVPAAADRGKRAAALMRWYRERLREQLPGLIARWEPVVGVKVAECRIKRMKTRWGSCNIAARRVWLNLELARKPSSCLEYVLVHEMVHLHERLHNQRFREMMDRAMPQWRLHREELNRAPLRHEDWGY